FFQAEDGIRDRNVTGVQTCALPISDLPVNYGGLDEEHSSLERARVVILPVPYDRTASYMKGTARGPEAIVEASRFMELYDDEIRSEERRVGKEWRLRGALRNEVESE